MGVPALTVLGEVRGLRDSRARVVRRREGRRHQAGLFGACLHEAGDEGLDKWPYWVSWRGCLTHQLVWQRLLRELAGYRGVVHLNMAKANADLGRVLRRAN